MFLRISLLLTILFTITLNATTSPDSVAGTFSLGEIEVIGSAVPRSALPVDRLIDPSEHSAGGSSLADAMKQLPGVHLRTIGERNEKAIYVRGFDLKRVPLFLDGIPIYVPYDGYPDLGRFFVNDISAVVVSKGYSSVLYGPNTMGGAINMISRKPDERLEGRAGISYGTGNTRRSYLNIGSRQNYWYLQAGSVYSAMDHIRIPDPESGSATAIRDNSYENDTKASIKIGYTPNRQDEYAIGYSYQSGEKGNPTYLGAHPSMGMRYWQWPEWNKTSVYFSSRTSIRGHHQVQTRLYYDTFDNALYSYDDGTYSTMDSPRSFRSYHNDFSFGGSIQYTYDAGRIGTLRGAAHYKQDVHRDQQNEGPRLRFADEIFSTAIEMNISLSGNSTLIGGMRVDKLQSIRAENYNEEFDRIDRFADSSTLSYNPQAGIVYNLSDQGSIFATISRNTRLPSMRDRYSFRLGRTIPNPSLTEERATHYEIGYSGLVTEQLFVKTDLYFSNVDDFIMFIPVPDPDVPGHTIEQNVNIGDLHKYGVDLTIYYQLHPRSDFDLSYSFIKINNHSSDDKVINIPNHSVNGEFSLYLDWITIRSSVEMYSQRYSSSNGERIADGFVVNSMNAEFPIYDNSVLSAGINNIFNTAYEYYEGFPQPGRNYFISIRIVW